MSIFFSNTQTAIIDTKVKLVSEKPKGARIGLNKMEENTKQNINFAHSFDSQIAA